MQLNVLTVTTRFDKDDLARHWIGTGMRSKVSMCIIHRRGIIGLQQSTCIVNSRARESAAEKRIAYWWLSLQKKLVSFILVLYIFVYLAYSFTPLVTGDIFPLPGHVPKVCRELPRLVVVYPMIHIVSALRWFAMTSCDCYVAIFACQLFSELQLVQQAILDLNQSKKMSIERVIARHVRALEYGRMYRHNCSVAIVAQHCQLSIFACLAALSLLYLKNKALLYNFFVLLIISSSQLLLLCLVGDKIAAESMKIGDCLGRVYVEFLDDATSLKAILAMLTRAQRPLLLRVGEKFIVDLNLYRLAMGNISSMFLVLKKFIDE